PVPVNVQTCPVSTVISARQSSCQDCFGQQWVYPDSQYWKDILNDKDLACVEFEVDTGYGEINLGMVLRDGNYWRYEYSKGQVKYIYKINRPYFNWLLIDYIWWGRDPSKIDLCNIYDGFKTRGDSFKREFFLKAMMDFCQINRDVLLHLTSDGRPIKLEDLIPNKNTTDNHPVKDVIWYTIESKTGVDLNSYLRLRGLFLGMMSKEIHTTENIKKYYFGKANMFIDDESGPELKIPHM
ncbi:MAG: hypothetical protein WC889_11965, partial [Myxococcota bacterium]